MPYSVAVQPGLCRSEAPKTGFLMTRLMSSTDDLLLFQISNGVVWQTRDLHLSCNKLYLLSPHLCFFIILKRDLFVYRDDSLTS